MLECLAGALVGSFVDEKQTEEQRALDYFGEIRALDCDFEHGLDHRCAIADTRHPVKVGEEHLIDEREAVEAVRPAYA